MLYPQKLSSKKSDFMIVIAILFSVAVGGILVLINHFTTPDVHWAGLANAGILYVWVNVFYAINHNTNIAGYVLLETFAISFLTSYIDYKTGNRGWAMSFAIPIVFNAKVVFTKTAIPAIIISIEHIRVIVQYPDLISFHTNVVWKSFNPSKIIQTPRKTLNMFEIIFGQSKTITPIIMPINAIVKR